MHLYNTRQKAAISQSRKRGCMAKTEHFWKSCIVGRLLRPDIVHFRSACGGT